VSAETVMSETFEEYTMDAALAAQVIQAQFVGVGQHHVRWLGEGYDSVAFEADGDWVFRFPKRRAVEQQLLLEMRVLPMLGNDSPLSMPAYSFKGAPSPLFPLHFGGYRKVLGVPAIGIDPRVTPFDRWAVAVADFLSWLHTFPSDQAARVGVPHRDADSSIEEARIEALQDFEHVAGVAPELIVEGWIEFLSEAPVKRSESPHVSDCLVHGDFAAEHVLYDAASDSITGVIDWSEVAIGDPTVDLAGVFHWAGESFLSAVLSTYRGPTDAATLERARYRAGCRGIGDLVFGMEANRAEYVAAGVRALNFVTAPEPGGS
jgi:aminoglycoside phosphotransferase (APT) family kinase protein